MSSALAANAMMACPPFTLMPRSMGRVMCTCADVHPLDAGPHSKSRAFPGLQQRSMPGPSRASAPASPPYGMWARSAAADAASHAASVRPGHEGVPGRTPAPHGRVCSEASARLKHKSRGDAGLAATLNSTRREAQHSAGEQASLRSSAASKAAAKRGVEEPDRSAAPSWQEFTDDVNELGCDMTPEKQQQHSARQAPPACNAIFATQYD